MYIFEQSTGRLLLESATGPTLIATGYSGLGEHKDDPLSQHLEGLGPIPIGQYMIGDAFHSDKSGPLTMHLIPQAGTNTYGRSAFEMHGDSADHPGAASHGCIIVPPVPRKSVADSRDRILTVVSGLSPQ
jgi:type VI secretion system (T6SS) effector TldE1-like protein